MDKHVEITALNCVMTVDRTKKTMEWVFIEANGRKVTVRFQHRSWLPVLMRDLVQALSDLII